VATVGDVASILKAVLEKADFFLWPVRRGGLTPDRSAGLPDIMWFFTRFQSYDGPRIAPMVLGERERPGMEFQQQELSPGSVTPVTPTDSGFTNRDFTCDIGIYYRRSVDDIRGLNSYERRAAQQKSSRGPVAGIANLACLSGARSGVCVGSADYCRSGSISNFFHALQQKPNG
jgi:hypothetical protein